MNNNLITTGILIVLGIVGLIELVVPGTFWRITRGWQFQNPDAVRPSKWGLLSYRLTGAVLLGFVIFFFWGLFK